jgi:hypothetical protein
VIGPTNYGYTARDVRDLERLLEGYRAAGCPVPGTALSPAQNVANAARLARDLKFEQLSSQFRPDGTLTAEAIRNSAMIIPRSDIINPAIPLGFNKYTTPSFPLPSRAGSAQTHFYMNPSTREVFYGRDYKTNISSSK